MLNRKNHRNFAEGGKSMVLACGKNIQNSMSVVPCIKIFDTMCFGIKEKSHGFTGKLSLLFCASLIQSSPNNERIFTHFEGHFGIFVF